MNKAASLAVKSLLGVGSVAGAASGGIILWNKRVSETTKKEKASENPVNKEVSEEDKENQKAPERVVDQENSKAAKEEKADERGSLKTQDELQITGNSKEGREDDDKGNLKQQIDAEDPNDPAVKARKEKEAKQMEERSVNWKDGQASLESEEKSWLPDGCNMERAKSNSECDLTSGDLKKIKFKDLGEGKEEVTVSPNDNVNIKLKIFQPGDMSKKFLFTNSSSTSIVISKGDKKVTLKAGGKTEFLREKEGLAMEKLKDYGIPVKCVNAKGVLVELKPEHKGNKNIKQCVLTEGDLSKIKFHGFPDGVESEVTPIWEGDENKGWGRTQNIILTIENGKYGFYNVFPELIGHNKLAHRPIKITRGGVSVTLEGNMESEFTVEDDSLKKQEVSELGFPKNCEIGEKEENECVLSDNDIRRLKLKETGISPDLLPVDGNRKMKLKIVKDADNSTYPDGKKYILSALDSSTTISNTAEVKDGVGKSGQYGTNSLTFDKDVEKTFKKEGDYLVEVS